ncbi:MAG: hypothetical protein IMF05_04020 [Proteobacteria bacterium]|nr:hypothetical protein [Pseudomonadota bacterium]MCK4868595.1 hypothetical protein [Alphaproteobacteria bacterium]
METSESGLNFLVVTLVSVVVLAIIVRRRYGLVGKRFIERLGPWWPRIIKIGSIATMVLWLIIWITVSPERRAELNKHYQDNAPWVVRDKSDP